MDGDHTAKTLDAGANSATKGATDFSEGIHESAHQAVLQTLSSILHATGR